MPWNTRHICRPRGIDLRVLPLCAVLLIVADAGLAATPKTPSAPQISVRQVRAGNPLPVPEPKPIVMDDFVFQLRVPGDDSRLAFDDAGAKQLPNGTPLPPNGNSPDTPPGLPTDVPPEFPKREPDRVPSSVPGGPPASLTQDQQAGNYGAQVRSGSHNDNSVSTIEFPLSEIFTLRAFEQIGKTRQVVTNRDDFVLVLGAAPGDGKLAKPVDSIRVVGRKLRTVELTLIGERGVRRYLLRITPSIAQIEALIARQFPLSSVEVTAAGDHVLILSGTVESPGEAEEILSLVQEFAGRGGKVINGIKVAGVMQVQLEVIIARVDRSEQRRLGLNFEYAGNKAFAGSQLAGIGGVTPIASSVANNAATGGGNAFQSIGGAASSVVTPASTAFVGVTNNLQQFMAQIEALQTQGLAKVLARPVLVTLNGRPAEFLVGGEQPFPYQTSALSTPSVDFKKFGTRLNFVPVILSPDKIRLDLVPENSSVNFTQAINVGGNQIPQFITQRIHTTVEMEPGQTLVLGGLLQTEIASQVQKFPVLGDLPLIGAAFRRVTHDEREIELIVVVTPRLVHPRDEADCPLPLPGDESRVPTDKELYFHGMPEVPACPPQPSGVGFVPFLPQTSKSMRTNPSDTARAVVLPVIGRKTERSSKPWLRPPGFKARQKSTQDFTK